MFFKSGIAVVLSHIQVLPDAPVEIIPGYTLRKASVDEAVRIAQEIRSVYGRGVGGPPHELDTTPNPQQEGSYSFRLLPPDQWRYWVVAFNGYGNEMDELQLAMNLAYHSLDIGFHLFYAENDQTGKPAGMRWGPSRVVDHFSISSPNAAAPMNIGQEDIEEIREISRLYAELPKDYQQIHHAVRNFELLKQIPETSELLVIGYFAIIESLVAHKPRGPENLDSTTHQVVAKLALLQKRFAKPVVSADFFGDVQEKKVWTKLYAFRSDLAHGNIPDFQKELRDLKDRATVTRFLKDTLKCLIVLAMKEPEFIADLKNC